MDKGKLSILGESLCIYCVCIIIVCTIMNVYDLFFGYHSYPINYIT